MAEQQVERVDEPELSSDDSAPTFDERPSPVWLAIWGLTAVGGALAFVPVSEIWRRRPEYHDRFLVPMAGLWIAHLLWPKLKALPAAGRLAGLGFVPFLGGVASFAVAWFLYMQVGGMRILVWWLLGSVTLIVAGLVAYQLGWRALRLLLFPLAFNAFCLPLPGKLHGPLERGLKEITTQISARGLPMVGIPTVRNGHVLVLSSGELGVEDACSGIRSFGALMAIACLVAFWRGFGWFRGAMLMALTVPVVVLANGARVIATGVLQEKVGRWAVEGWAHEALGFLVVFVGLGLIIGLSQLLRLRSDVSPFVVGQIVPESDSAGCPMPTSAVDVGEDADDPESIARWSRSDLRGLPALAVLLFGAVGVGIATRYFRTEPAADVRLADLSNNIGRWTGYNVDVPDFIQEQLVYDRAVNRVFRSPTGHDVSVWIIYWSATDFIPGPHNPDICWPSRGWQITGSGRLDLVSKEQKTAIPAEFREYARGGREQFLAFWTQENNVVLKSMERNLDENIGDKSWILNALLRRNSKLRPSKMFVLIGAESWGTKERTRQEVTGFCEAFVDELYRVAPELRPGEQVERLPQPRVGKGGPEFQIDRQ